MSALDRLPDGSATSPQGFHAAGVAAGLKDGGQLDVGVLVSALPCAAAGVFTQNRVRAAPVLYDEALLNERPGRLRGVVMNSRVANACTGERGLKAADAMARAAESAFELPPRTMLVLSTGVIGVQLPVEKVERAIQRAAKHAGPAGGPELARAIMTTDTRPKTASTTLRLGGTSVTVAGIAKGVGLISPHMATMLGFVVTDAVATAPQLRAVLNAALPRSFNAITVDGDMSTNDSVIVMASGAAGNPALRGRDLAAFGGAIEGVCAALARELVRDGEGAATGGAR